MLNTKSHSEIKEVAISEYPKKYYLVFAIFTVAALGLLAQILSYYFNYNYAYRDSIFRMEAARRFFDSTTPGINQIGTVWLPVPNLILMPFAYVDFLWETGLAASIVNFPSFIVSAVLVFMSIRKLTDSPAASWFGFLIFVFNYNVLYFQTTAMTEQLYLLFLLSGFYFLILWISTAELKYLIYSSILITLNTGVRYDAWPFAIAAIALVYLSCRLNKNEPVKHSIIYGLLPVFLITLWFEYNLLRYGDALEFARGEFSTLRQLQFYEAQGRLLTKNNFWLSAKVYFHSVFLYSGVSYALIALIGLIISISKNRLMLRILPAYILLLSFPTTLLLLFKGQLIIETPLSQPPGYFNSRYGLYLFPAITIFSGITVSYLMKWRLRRLWMYVLACIFIIQQLAFLEDLPANIPSLAEAKYSYNKSSQDLTSFLEKNYKGGKVLYDNLVFALDPRAGINLAERITYYTLNIAEMARTNPSKYVNWVLIYKEAHNDKIYDAVRNNPDFLNNFELRFSEGGIEAYSKK